MTEGLAPGLGQCVAAAVGRPSMYKERSVSTRLGCMLLVHAMLSTTASGRPSHFDGRDLS